MGEFNTDVRHVEDKSEKPQTTKAPTERSTRPRNAGMNANRKVKRKGDDGPLKQLAGWLFDNQAGLCFKFFALLFLAHNFVPQARPYALKFFSLSYFNANTGKYAAGYDDFYFITFCILLLTGLRAATMEYALSPLAKVLGLSKKKEVTRFAEQGWMLIHYNVMWPLGMYVYYKSSYFLNMQELWTNWPQRELDGLTKAYMLGQWAFWIQQVLVIHIEDRRKDHWQMLSHHFITIALIAASYAYHQTRVGNLILVLMDVVDLIFPLAKCLKYLGFTTICDILFGVFIVLWLVTRHVFYLMTCWSVYYDIPRLIPAACYSGTANDLKGPFPVPKSGWSHLLDPFRDPAGTVCFNENITFAFLSYLLFLQGLMLLWSVFIVRVALRVLQGSSAEDIRSDGEEEEDDAEEEYEYEELQPLEEEVGVEALNLKGWERRTGVNRAASSTGVILPRHSDRKELLNRIGCEKQID